MMLIYLICLVVGGTFVLLAAIGGLDGADVAADVDVELTADTSADMDDVDVCTLNTPPPGSQHKQRPWRPFLSLRFWTFFLCFLGLTGVLISWGQSALASWVIAVIAIFMGLVCGTIAASVLRSLSRNSVSSLTRPEELTGQIGIVEIPFDADSRGKVRLSLRGSTVGFFAFTQEARAFQPGESVLVVGLENNKLWVVSADALPPQTHDGGK
jgi:membrane protein implicated in regulation of membrane protease activity